MLHITEKSNNLMKQVVEPESCGLLLTFRFLGKMSFSQNSLFFILLGNQSHICFIEYLSSQNVRNLIFIWSPRYYFSISNLIMCT